MTWASLALLAAACSPDLDSLDGGPGARDGGVIEERICDNEGETVWVGTELEGCTVHRGTIALRCPKGLEDFSYLYALREVQGGLNIDQCFDSLVSLRGLERLERVGSLRMSELPLVRDLSPLASLTRVQEYLILSQLDGLIDLRGLQGVESVGVRLWLTQLEGLENLDGLEGLRTVGSLWIDYNDSLQSLAGLSGLELVEGGLRIRANGRLHQSEIDALLSRIEVRGQIIIE